MFQSNMKLTNFMPPPDPDSGAIQNYLSTKTYVVGTQKNHLIEMVLLSTQNTCFKEWIRKYSQFYELKVCLYLDLCDYILALISSYEI